MKARIDNAPDTPWISRLRFEIEILRSIDIDTFGSSAFEIQRHAALLSEGESPKSGLVVASFGVLGGVIGVLTALIRSAFRSRKRRLSSS